jgi:uncharacterized phage protein (TIGR02220 family)
MNGFYRTLDAGLWGDEKFRQLSPPQASGQFLWIYLLTGHHTDGLPGLYLLGEAALAEALGWPLEDLRVQFAALQSLGMALADWNAHVVFLPNALKYQAPCNQKQLLGWGKAFKRVPECDLKLKWLRQLEAIAARKGNSFTVALNEGFGTVCDTVSPPNPNPQPNPRPNARSAARSAAGGPPETENIPVAAIVALLNRHAAKRFRHGSAQTRRLIEDRWREGYRVPDFERVIQVKCGQWLHTPNEPYLRPQTLFGGKFEAYVNERSARDLAAASPYPDMDDEMRECRGS